MDIKQIIEIIQYYWKYSKTKVGLGIAAMMFAAIWVKYALPIYNKESDALYTNITITILCFVALGIVWLLYSGRLMLTSNVCTIIFCLKANDSKSAKYIENSLTLLKHEMDKIGLLDKIKLKNIGTDIISTQKQAHKFREKYDVDMIIWGDVYSGTIDQKEVCDFKNILYTYKIPKNIIIHNVVNYFKNDINIALVNRDWNIYEINSISDTEKVTCNLTEIIMFVMGLIYCQNNEFVEDSVIILERLFDLLATKSNGDKIIIDNDKNEISMSPTSLRTGRVLGILTKVYHNIGIEFTLENNYQKGYYYLEKYLKYNKYDIPALSSIALCAFRNNEFNAAKNYTETIGKIDKNNQIYILNQGFFGIYEKNYASALYFYKESAKRGKKIESSVITSVIAFLDERYKEDPREIAYEFAIGILNKYHCQRNEGMRELRRFTRKAKNKSEYADMVKYTNGILEKQNEKTSKRRQLQKRKK